MKNADIILFLNRLTRDIKKWYTMYRNQIGIGVIEMIQKLVNKHNDMIDNGENKFNQLKELQLQILELFNTLNKADTIKYYNQMADSVVKFNLFQQIQKNNLLTRA